MLGGPVGRGGGTPANGGRAQIDPSKYDYLFGNVASNAHNAARSAQNARQLARIGIHDSPAGRSLLQNHFDDLIARTDNIARSYTNGYGTFQVRESLLAGPGGFVKFESTWQVTDSGLRLTTVIPMGG
jgi:filamentous hemagglutinin